MIEVLGGVRDVDLDPHLGRAFEGLMAVPAPTYPESMARLDKNAYRRVIGRLQSLVGILVLDCGTGLQERAARHVPARAVPPSARYAGGHAGSAAEAST